MSDDLAKRLRSMHWCVTTETNGVGVSDRNVALEAADRIEALTAERDAAYAQGYSDAETEISKSALGQRNDFLHSQYANAADHIKVLTSERDRLRGALEGLMAHEPDYSDTLWQDARAALKGEKA